MGLLSVTEHGMGNPLGFEYVDSTVRVETRAAGTSAYHPPVPTWWTWPCRTGSSLAAGQALPAPVADGSVLQAPVS
jgi:hypothetical protein